MSLDYYFFHSLLTTSLLIFAALGIMSKTPFALAYCKNSSFLTPHYLYLIFCPIWSIEVGLILLREQRRLTVVPYRFAM